MLSLSCDLRVIKRHAMQILQKRTLVKKLHSPQTGIVLLNKGGPNKTEDVESFLLRVLKDRQLNTFPALLGSWYAKRLTPEFKKKYEEIGGSSPTYDWTQKQGDLLCNKLDKVSPYTAPHKYYVAFRYSKPTTEDAFTEIESDGVKRVILFSQYPQYSCATSGSSFNEVYSFYKNRSFPCGVKLGLIDRWATHPLLIKTFANLIRSELRKLPEKQRYSAIILFTANSLPLDIVNRGDSYPSEIGATVQMVMQELNNCNPYQLSYQSKTEVIASLGPFTDDTLKGYVEKGKKSFLLVPIGFVNEHVDTLYDMDIEFCKNLASAIRVENIRRVPTPNDNPMFIDAMTNLVKSHMEIGPRIGPKFLNRCPHCVNPICLKSKEWFEKVCDDF